MKIILTEKQLKKILIFEQVPISNLLDVGSMTGTGNEIPGNPEIYYPNECIKYKSTKQLIRELFLYARRTNNQPKTTDENIQKKINSLSNLNNLDTVLSQITSIEELGSVLNGYNNKNGYPLSNKISEEKSKTVWEKIKKFNKNFIDVCKTRYNSKNYA